MDETEELKAVKNFVRQMCGDKVVLHPSTYDLAIAEFREWKAATNRFHRGEQA